MPGARRFWIGVASRDHVDLGVKGGFVQLNHGTQGAVRRLKAGDGVIMYSPRTAYPDGERLQAFTAIGTVVTGDVYQVELTPAFKPHRVNCHFAASKEAPIKPLVERLSFIKNKSHWGAAFRFCLNEIKSDFGWQAALSASTAARLGEPVCEWSGRRDSNPLTSVPNRARYQASLLPDVLNSLLDARCTRFLGAEPSCNLRNRARTTVISRLA